MTTPFAFARDLVGITAAVPAAAYVAATAGGSGDNTLVTGLTLNRASLVQNGLSTLTGILPTYVMFNLFYEAVLAGAATLSIKTVLIEDSANGSSWATFLDQTSTPRPNGWPASGVVDTGGTGGTTQRGIVRFGANIQGARQYIRIKYTPDLSASGTDTGKFTVSALFAAFQELPPGTS